MARKSRQPEAHDLSVPIGNVTLTVPDASNENLVESAPGICGGQACIAGTRIPVYILEQYRRLGASDEHLLSMYPTLAARDLAAAWEYVRHHRAEIEAQISRD